MEMPLGSYEKEYLKMAILKHEETFKEQVYELHRLYRIQKILMNSIGSSNAHAFAGNNNTNNEYSSSCCVDNKTVAIEEESQVELTLGLATTYNYDNKSKNRSTIRSYDKFGSHHDDVELAAGERGMKQHYPPWIFQVLTLNSS